MTDTRPQPDASRQPHQQQRCDKRPRISKRFRPAGSPAGTWPTTPWWHCVFHDRYERVNFWSHAVPGVCLLLLGLLSHQGVLPGGAALWVFCGCAASTHLLSALTHVWPDDSFLEKLDHLGIVMLICGTPLSQMMALPLDSPHRQPWQLAGACLGLLVCAFMRPLLRVGGFVGIGGIMVWRHWAIVDVPLAVQCLLYVSGAAFFVRNGGHDRLWGLQDHHLLHYKVTIACGIHVANIMWRAHAAGAE